MPKLTDVEVREKAAEDKQYTVADGGGLSLLVKPNGTKAWRYNYRYGGKQKTLAIGVYPDISLKQARARLAEAKRLLADGLDPSLEKKRKRRQAVLDSTNTLEALAKDWWQHQKGTWSETHAARVWQRLNDNVLKELGHRSITDIDPQDIIAAIRRVENRGALDVAQRVLQATRALFRYAVQIGRLKQNPIIDVTPEILKGRITQHQPSMPREQLPDFLRALEGYHQQGRLLTQLAIQLLVLTFVRPGELRAARWEEFDWEQKLWRIPAARMKMGTEHIVPLSTQAVAILEQIKSITGAYELVFPSERNRHQCMSDNTMRRAIFKLGYDGNTPGKSKCVPHGFRATASSILNETGFNPDAIERQLSHMERDGVRAAYTHHARYLEDRKAMMQWWGDYLEELKEPGKVVSIFANQN